MGVDAPGDAVHPSVEGVSMVWSHDDDSCDAVSKEEDFHYKGVDI